MTRDMKIKIALAAAAVGWIAGYPISAKAADKGGQGSGILPIGEMAKAGSVNWSGFYLGGNVGYGWLDAEHAQTNGGMVYGPFDANDKGFMGGLVIGYNLQTGPVVFGIEAEGGYMDIDGSGRIPSSTPGHYQAIDVDGGFYGLVAGRIGFAFQRSLIYAKGGYAVIDGTVGQTTTKPGYETHRSDALHGAVYGAGIEYAFSDRMSMRFEWLRFDLETATGNQESISDDPVGYKYTNKTDGTIDSLKLGLSFKF